MATTSPRQRASLARTPKEHRPRGNGNKANATGGPNNSNNDGNGLGFRRGIAGWAILIGAAVMVLFVVNQQTTNVETIPWTTFTEKLTAPEDGISAVRAITIDGATIRGEFRPDTPLKTATGETVGRFQTSVPAGMANDYNLLKDIEAMAGTSVSIEADNSGEWYVYLLPLIPWLLIFGFIYFFLIRQLRAGGGAGGMLGNFGRSKHRITSKENTNVTFDDVAGVEEAKDEVSRSSSS